MIKTTAFAYCVVLLLPVSAADILVNGDFSDGIAHWKGDGRNASDTGVDDMGSLSRPAGGNGMIITLKPDRWTKIYQEFDTKEAALDFHLSYKLSPDISTSGGRGGLANPLSIITGLNVSGVFSLPEHMERGGPASTWVLVVADPDNMLVSYVPIEPKAGMAETQTASGSIPHLLVHENKTLYLAFPPGTGTATIENIALTPSVPITVPPAATPSSPPSPPPDPYPFPNAKDNLLSSDGWSGNVNEANDDDSAKFPGQPAKLIWPLAAKLRSHALQYLAHPFHATTFPLMIWIDATPSSQNYDDVFHFKVRDVLHQYEKG